MSNSRFAFINFAHSHLQKLSNTRVLWITFFLTLFLTICFGLVMYFGQFKIIDEMYVAEDILAHVNAMTPTQRLTHAWLTGTVDVLYPFAYGAFFIGIAMKSFGRFGILLAIPSLLVIPADLTEGFAQVMLLQGHEEFMSLKVSATPIKLLLYATGLFITVIGLFLIAKDILKRRKYTDEN